MSKVAYYFLLFSAFLILTPVVFACIVPKDGMLIENSAQFCPEVYYLNKGMSVSGNNITIDCNGAVLKSWSGGKGFSIEHSNNVTIKDCRIVNYNTAFYARNSSRIFLLDNHLIKNQIGVGFVGVKDSATLNYDVSLKTPFEILESSNNILSLTNKKISGVCQENYCNKARSVVEQFMVPPVSKQEFKSWLGEKLTGKSEKRLKEIVILGLS